MEHQTDFVPRLAVLDELLLNHQGAGADACVPQTSFFAELSCQRRGRTLAGLHMSAREKQVPPLPVAAEQDSPPALQNSSGNDLNTLRRWGGFGVWHERMVETGAENCDPDGSIHSRREPAAVR